MNKIELLAPAGSYDALVAAVESGADAVYMGGSRFNARAYADNFDDEKLKQAVEYAHVRGVKVYVTVNILLSDKELYEVFDYIKYLYSIDVDAVIVQDIALVRIIKDFYPDMEVHCSTQMTVHNAEGARFLKEMGVKRIVLARELSVSEIKYIVDTVGIEVEIFVHGALCVSYSGQCLMSSMIGGRSGNRGKCAQPCRKKYSLYDMTRNRVLNALKNTNLMSTRDLNTYSRLKEVLESGASSLKIEGRMKRPEYVAIVVKNYKDAILSISKGKSKYSGTQAEYELASAFNREFTEGYLFNKRNSEIVSIERPDNRGLYVGKVSSKSGSFITIDVEEHSLADNDGIEIIDKNGKSTGTIISGIKSKGRAVDKVNAGNKAEVFIRDNVSIGSRVSKTLDSELFKRVRQEYYFENKIKIDIKCKLHIHIGEIPTIILSDYDGNSVIYKANELIEEAQRISTSEEKIISQLQKTGDVPYNLVHISIDMDSNCNVPVRIVNELRREAMSLLSKARADKNKRKGTVEANAKKAIESYFITSSTNSEKHEFVAGVRSVENAASALEAGIDTIYVLYHSGLGSEHIKEIVDLCNSKGTASYIVLPEITKDNEIKDIEVILKKGISDWSRTGIVVSNIGQIALANKLKPMKIRANYSMNVFNSITAGFYAQQLFDSVCISTELKLSQIKEIYRNSKFKLEGMIYGHLPVMITEYCPASMIGECTSCNSKREIYGIQDEKGKVFPVLKDGYCRSRVLNSDVLYTIEDIDTIGKNGINIFRADFYHESNNEVYDIVKLMIDQHSKVKNSDVDENIKAKGFTKGHYFRGVE